jgi:hypothetical protein
MGRGGAYHATQQSTYPLPTADTCCWWCCWPEQVRHKNVVQFIGACTRKPNLCIVFEYMSGGSLYDYIRREGSLKLSQVGGGGRRERGAGPRCVCVCVW